MKKIFMMICAAAAVLAGCQNVEEGIEGGAQSGLSIKAVATVPTMNRTHLVESEGVYKAWWSDGDYVNLIENANGTISRFLTQITEDCESAELTFEDINPQEADEYKYVLTYPDPVASNTIVIDMSIPTEQNFFRSDSYADNCDILLSKPVTLDHQPVGESINFEMVRLSAVAKMTLKNFAIPAGEAIKNVVFSCDSPITGEFSVNIADISAEGTPIEITKGVNSVSTNKYEPITDPATQQVVVYFSVLPTTLKAGESYTITVETDKANYTKIATLASALQFKAGSITAFSANMNGAASKTKLANLSEEYEYALGFTHTETGKVYLINRTAIAKNPTVQELSTLGVTLDANGTIVGEISKAYRWNYKNDGGHQFYYITGSGNEAHLIAGDKNQGIAVQSANNGVYKGAYSVEYTDVFVISAADGGYDITYGNELRDLDVNPTNGFVNAPGKNTLGVWNFYRIQSAPYKTLYPVITKAAHVTDGTYVFLAKKTTTDEESNVTTITYYALPNAVTSTAPVAVTADQVSITLDENTDCVTAANISNDYKWIIQKMDSKDAWNVMSAVDKSVHYWQRENAGGQAVCSQTYKTDNDLSGKLTNDWTFFDDATKGMQAQTSGGAAKNRKLWINDSGVWANATVAADAIVLVKLSSSTEQIASE